MVERNSSKDRLLNRRCLHHYLELCAQSLGVGMASIGTFSELRIFILSKSVVGFYEVQIPYYRVYLNLFVSLAKLCHASSLNVLTFSCVNHSVKRARTFGEGIQKMRVFRNAFRVLRYPELKNLRVCIVD